MFKAGYSSIGGNVELVVFSEDVEYSQVSIPTPVRWVTVQQFLLDRGNFGVAFLQVKAQLDLCPCERGLCMVLASVAACSGN